MIEVKKRGEGNDAGTEEEKKYMCESHSRQNATDMIGIDSVD
jgi:hypothetical protein